MAAEPIILNPLGWGQAKLLGGLKRTLMICLVYFGAAWVIMMLFYRALDRDVSLPEFAGGALVFFLFALVGILVFAGSNVIKKAIQRDFTSDMINSHRLTAMSGPTAVLGYLTGPTSQVVALTLTNWIICSILALIVGPGPARTPWAPTIAMLIAFCGAMMCWTLSALVALASRGKILAIPIVIIALVAMKAEVGYILPGLTLIIPDSIMSITRRTFVGVIDGRPMIVAMIAQLALAFAFFLGAARKYTRDDVPAYRGPLAYAFLALLTLICAAGFFVVPQTPGRIGPEFCVQSENQLTATLIVLALAALVPIASAARDSANWERRRKNDSQFAGPRPRNFLEAPLLAGLIVIGIVALVLTRRLAELFSLRSDLSKYQQMAAAGAAFLFSLVTAAGVLRFSLRIMTQAGWLATLILLFLWILPVSLDLVLDAAGWKLGALGQRSWLFACSPLGAWIASITAVQAPLTVGLIIQGLIAAIAIQLAQWRRQPRVS